MLLPPSVSFLLRVIVLTDSVISFNSAKGLTNTLATVLRTVTHLAKSPVSETHYRQIRVVCGEIYCYRKSWVQTERLPVIGMVEIANRVRHCERQAVEWVRQRYLAGESPPSSVSGTKEIDQLISTDREFQANIFFQLPLPPLVSDDVAVLAGSDDRAILTPISAADDLREEVAANCQHQAGEAAGGAGATVPASAPAASPRSPPVPPPTKRARPILDRIREREAARKQAFIALEKARQQELAAALRTIILLGRTESRKSFEKQFLQQRLPVFSKGLITLDEVITHPGNDQYLTTKTVDGTVYVLLNISAYLAHNPFCTQ